MDRIQAFCVSVDYSFQLSQSLLRWVPYADVTIVTAPRDETTQALCAEVGVSVFETDVFWQNGCDFNKSGALDLAIQSVNPKDWILLFDADVIPPVSWKNQLDLLKPEPGNLYGARRVNERGIPYPDGELAGFFVLFHASDPRWTESPRLGNYRNASAYDSDFMQRWPHHQRVILPINLIHMGEPGRNWCGVGNDSGLRQMFRERRLRGGYQHERLDGV